ncbi:DedA family protein [Thermoflexus sp.]|uniref:DedA family protein n=1 Tax=Thermoflexus sp. TaxID=1969742 RepID=UPI0025DBD467|nr:DedA family protein [Thermoflexus sp.]MDW8181039.1 DedA family protein [Anaerolineae bacterium]MCS6964315.1 DedA family protein [Thermoflexus sp.]MCS7351581.1 DedA family protein [Thermoflexus sp.]MCX7689240.1 DedA family protein [Thermoflexus sp.]MDW8183776.1 DedA family protein [Anaerolineae bacterium]
MEALEHQLVLFLQNLFQWMGWGGAAIVMALESANIPIPSEVTMPLAGWMLVQARGGTLLQAALAGGWYGGLGCTLGSLLSYGMGYYGGRPFLFRYGRYLLISPRDLEAADRWFVRWGMWATFISRLLPIVRTFISFPAGVTRIPIFPFALLSFVGSFIWCAGLAMGGYLFGQHWEELRRIMRPFDIPIAFALLGGFAYYLYRHIRHAREGYDALIPGRGDADPPAEMNS